MVVLFSCVIGNLVVVVDRISVLTPFGEESIFTEVFLSVIGAFVVVVAAGVFFVVAIVIIVVVVTVV